MLGVGVFKWKLNDEMPSLAAGACSGNDLFEENCKF